MCRVRHDDKLVYALINQLNHFIQWAKEVYYCHCERSSWSFGPVCVILVQILPHWRI